jgi:O-antigen chain-terminating methyltransferase
MSESDRTPRTEDAAAGSRAAAAGEGPASELAAHHAYLRGHWDAKACEVDSHRGGAAGRLVAGAKRLMHRLTRPYLNVVLARQTRFNDRLVALLNVLLPQHESLLARERQSELRLDAGEALDRESGARLTALERQLYSGTAQTEALLARLQRIVEEQSRAGLVSPGAAAAVAEARVAGRGASYLAFEDQHRGPREEIKRRQAVYLPHFRSGVGSGTPLLDLGCGRGEFLELCREAGLPARGVDVSPAMVAACRELGLDVAEADGLAHLRTLPPASLGGILLSQVIEHLGLDQLTELVALCAEKLVPGGALIAETVNPESLSTFAGAFYVDLTHTKPVHPEAASFLWRWAGLGDVQVLYLSPVPADQRLEPLPGGADAPAWVGVFNRNVDRLNRLVYGPLDYAVVGRK